MRAWPCAASPCLPTFLHAKHPLARRPPPMPHVSRLAPTPLASPRTSSARTTSSHRIQPTSIPELADVDEGRQRQSSGGRRGALVGERGSRGARRHVADVGEGADGRGERHVPAGPHDGVEQEELHGGLTGAGLENCLRAPRPCVGRRSARPWRPMSSALQNGLARNAGLRGPCKPGSDAGRGCCLGWWMECTSDQVHRFVVVCWGF